MAVCGVLFTKHALILHQTHAFNKYLLHQIGVRTASTFKKKHVLPKDGTKVIFGKPGSPSAMQEQHFPDEEFRTLLIPGHNQTEDEAKTQFVHITPPTPRMSRMDENQDWSNVWPTAKTFNWAAVPLPLRQGRVYGYAENKGIPPEAHGNAELMKIPNFLHLTPRHIKKHCNALKVLCTPMPKELKPVAGPVTVNEDQISDTIPRVNNQRSRKRRAKLLLNEQFPIEVIRRSYVRDGINTADERARLVTLKVKLSVLQLDHHAVDKIKRLLGDKYDKQTGTITLSADRCPTKAQNLEYLYYLLDALYFESWEKEDWEVKAPEDMERYEWDVHPSRDNVLDLVKRVIEIKSEGKAEVTEEQMQNLEAVQEAKHATQALHNEGECEKTLSAYNQAMKKLLLGDSVKEIVSTGTS